MLVVGVVVLGVVVLVVWSLSLHPVVVTGVVEIVLDVALLLVV